MAGHAVVIAGAGPTGLMLAGELSLAGVDVVIVERRAGQDLVGQRAGGLLARTLEVLDQRGIVDRFLAEGTIGTVGIGFAGVPLDLSDVPTRHGYVLGLRQKHIERILAGWVAELGVPIHRERDVVGFEQDDGGVDVRLSDGRTLRADYLVGCDGGRSLVRKTAGIAFPGLDPSTSALLAEAELADEPPWGIHRDAIGQHAFTRLDDRLVGVMVAERRLGDSSEPTLRDLKEALVAAWGTDYGIHDPVSISRFTDATRQAAAYRHGRVLLAGDAAHVHSPDGGQGLGLGLQDAVNLGWKLAQVVNGISPDTLLDTYHAERHPVDARALRFTMALTVLRRPDERVKALAGIVADLARMAGPRRHLAGLVSGLDVHYELGEGHPLRGRRVPDLDLVTTDGPIRLFSLLHDARPLLLDLVASGSSDADPWADRVRLVDARFGGPWELPVIGTVIAPSALLIRPDGYVAWVGTADRTGLAEALTTWFGPPAGA
ncbi:MAG TPA: FAD-dependent monooxygenase [Candidatus Limnocylindrales bacterium]|nr:FAD-dependent monooxygenase [Candidatus Limnocylindrales bacterium]